MDEIKSIIVSALSRIWRESKEYEFGSPEQMRRFHAFATIMEHIKHDFDEDFMVEMYRATCENVEELIQVIPGFVVKALEKRGEKFDIHSYARPAL
jgi:hypothetical protein